MYNNGCRAAWEVFCGYIVRSGLARADNGRPSRRDARTRVKLAGRLLSLNSYPYLLVWTNQVDIWHFMNPAKRTHVYTLSDYLAKAYDKPAPIIDQARELVILRVPYRTSPTQLRAFNLLDGNSA
jgi:hypothetical protein